MTTSAPTFALMISAGASGETQHTALQFAHAVLAGERRILRVFFFGEGVSAGSFACVPPPETDAIAAQWAALAAAHDIDLVVCATSAVRRGVLDAGESRRYDRPETLAPGFEISGLGQWVDACLHADRVVTFG